MLTSPPPAALRGEHVQFRRGEREVRAETHELPGSLHHVLSPTQVLEGATRPTCRLEFNCSEFYLVVYIPVGLPM